MKNKKLKKGFTLIELVVVIAVIGILAGVSVATYFAVINSAKKSNDEVLLTQLNTVLQTEEPISGKPKTMSEALKRLKDNGFLVENLKATSEDNKLFYNIKDNRFEMLGKEAVQALDGEEYWYIANSKAEVSEFGQKSSIYVTNKYTEVNENLEVKYGIDGNISSLENVNINNTSSTESDEIIVNVNTNNLTINADNDNVYHYANSKIVDITAVHENSYHEYGNVENLRIVKGHASFEKGASVGTINVAGNGAKITVSEEVKNPENVNIYVEPGIEAGAISKPSGVKDAIKKESVTSIESFIYPNFNDPSKRTDRYFIFNSDLTITPAYRDNIEINSRKNDVRKVVIDLNSHTLNMNRGDNSFTSLFCIGNSNRDVVECEIKNGTINYDSFLGIKLRTANLKLSNCNINFTKQIPNNYVGEKGSFIVLDSNSSSSTAQNILIENCIYNGNTLFDVKDSESFNSKDNVVIKGGTYKNLINDRNLITNRVNLTIDSGVFDSISDGSANGTIFNSGKITINGGAFNCTHKASLFNQGVAILNSGTFDSKSCPKCDPTIPNYTYSVYSGGTNASLTINKGTNIKGVHGGLAVTGGAAIINGGKIETVSCENKDHDTSHYALYFAGERSEAQIIVKDGEYTSFDKVAMYVGNSKDGGLQKDARVIVEGGTFNGNGTNKDAIHVDNVNGYLSVIGGKYSSDISKTLNGTVTTEQSGNYWIVK